MIAEINSLIKHKDELRLDLADLVERELAIYRDTPTTSGEYLLPNLWVNRNTGTRAYYELSFHDGKNYRMMYTHFYDRGEQINETEVYEIYQNALETASLVPEVPFNLTMCQIEPCRAETHLNAITE